MKLNKLFCYLMGAMLLIGTPSCTDEVEYTPAGQFTGLNVFFTSATSSVSLPENATEISVELLRGEASEALTANLSSSVFDNEGTELSDVFSVPSSVSFVAGEEKATITIGVNFANVVADTPYKINISIDGEDTTPYGPTSTAVTVSYSPWSPMNRYAGNDDYSTVTVSILGLETEVATYYSESLIKPVTLFQFGDYDCPELNDNEESWTYVASGMNYEVTLDNTTNYVTLTPTPIANFNVTNIGQRTGWMTDIYTYVSEINPGYIANVPNVTAEDFKGASKYNPETGLFEINTICYIPEGVLEDTYDYIQLPGFAHYEVVFNVVGNFVDQTGAESVIISAYKSEDLNSYTYEVYPGKLTDNEIAEKVAEIQANEDAVLYTDLTKTIQLMLTEEGPYTIVAVGYDKNTNKIYETSFEFTFSTVKADSPWVSIGTCLYTDDFVASAYNNMGGDTWEVEIEENKDENGYYRLVNPYKSWIEMMGAPQNYLDGDYYLYINASDPEGVYIPESPLGFIIDPADGQFIAYSMAARYLEAGNPLDAIKQAGYCGEIVDGVITFPTKSLLMSFENDASWYYANVNGYFSVVLDGSPAGVVKKSARIDLRNVRKSLKSSGVSYKKSKIVAKEGKVDFFSGDFYPRYSK